MDLARFLNKMKITIIGLVIVLGTFAFTTQLHQPATGRTLSTPIAAPDFTHSNPEEWLNSQPLRLNDLKGKVVLIDFWTFGCWNCYRSFPWLNAMEKRLKPQGLQIVGVHTPEFEHEKVKANIIKKIDEFDLHHPVMIDNDFSYWRSMGNRFWPAFYIIDKKGQVRAIFYGETHEGDERAKAIESTIKALIAEDIIKLLSPVRSCFKTPQVSASQGINR